jgi:UDP-N-acetylmuramoylalanine--D-glutamate ligase
MSELLDKIRDKNIHIVGVSGAEGSALAAFFYSLGFKNITGHDFCEKGDFRKSFFSFHDAMSEKEKEAEYSKLKKSKVKINFKENYLKDAEKADMIFVPQSWFRYECNEPLKKLSGKIELYNITKLYFDLCRAPIVAITGTSGKSTTSRLVYEILQRDKDRKGKVYFSGNDRENIQILDKIFNIKEDDILVLEVSNRQLKINFNKGPHIGIITNISPNHLDDHKDFVDYANTKKKLLKNQTEKDLSILNYDTKTLHDVKTKSKTYFFSHGIEIDRGAFLRGDDMIITDDSREYKICSTKDLKIPGPHNIENALAASLAGYLSAVNTKYIREALMEFKGLKSRIELVREINGIKYYNDSTACNPSGTIVAISSFIEPIILIAGGERKVTGEGEFEEMAKSIVEKNVKVLLLIGKKADLIEELVKKYILEQKSRSPIIKKCKDLAEAVQASYRSANKGDVVIMSPGCESFDMFSDYRDRARRYRNLVLGLS